MIFGALFTVALGMSIWIRSDIRKLQAAQKDVKIRKPTVVGELTS